MKYKYLSILAIALLFAACSSDEEYLVNKIEKTEHTRSTDAVNLTYPLSSFITNVDLSSTDQARLNEILSFMQTTLRDGYNPLFKILKSLL